MCKGPGDSPHIVDEMLGPLVSEGLMVSERPQWLKRQFQGGQWSLIQLYFARKGPGDPRCTVYAMLGTLVLEGAVVLERSLDANMDEVSVSAS